MVHIIHIQKDRETLLSFLYPQYSIQDSLGTSKFITHLNVANKRQCESLHAVYADCIIISDAFYEEDWNDEVLINKSIEFSRIHLGNRKKTLKPSEDNFVQDVVSYIFSLDTSLVESTIVPLFESVGSKAFVHTFLELLRHNPYQQLQAAIFTFLSKCNPNSSSLFYKKKGLVLQPIMKSNIESALLEYNLSSKGPLDFCKFIVSLTTKH